MAAALLQRRLQELHVAAEVETAGLLEPGAPATKQAVRLLADHGLDLNGHVSRRLTPELVGSADLVIGMEARHVREAVLLEPKAWPRAFVLPELVRRSEAIGPRTAEPLSTWLARLHLGRSTRDMLVDAGKTVADPHGGSDAAYLDTIDVLETLIARFTDLAWGHTVRR
jgi:protein-tyrosine-phosphatase